MPLLGRDEPPPVTVERRHAQSPYVLTCDHAGLAIPQVLGDLGLPTAERKRHIAWDIGALGVARELSTRLEAPLLWQNYSRLVIDCNRPPDSTDLIVTRSEATDILVNRDLDEVARAARVAAIYTPYHEAIAGLLDERAAAAIPTVFVAVHSFTPVYHGEARPWQLGVLYGRDDRLARALLDCLAGDGDLCVGDNQPYRIDGKDHTLPAHAFTRGLVNVLFEIRQDLIASPSDQVAWGRRLESLLTRALAQLEPLASEPPA
jgi:predicted N-formylglutamate amidohydrolase